MTVHVLLDQYNDDRMYPLLNRRLTEILRHDKARYMPLNNIHYQSEILTTILTTSKRHYA